MSLNNYSADFPPISFVVTFYNKQDFVTSVLQAVRDQRNIGAYEVVIIDDGSTDKTAELVKQFITDWPEAYLIEQKNKGPAGALNAGLNAAKYDFIKFVEGDDILHPDLTNRLCKVLITKNAVGVYVRTTKKWFNISGNKINPHEALIKNAPCTLITLKDHTRLGIGNGSMLFCRKDAVLAAGGCNKRVFVQDNTLNLGLAMLGKTYAIHLDNAIAFPKNYEGRVSSVNWQLLHDDAMAIYYFIEKYNDQLNWFFKARLVARFLKRTGHLLAKEQSLPIKKMGYKLKRHGRLGQLIPLSSKYLLEASEFIRSHFKIKIGYADENNL